MPGAMLTPRRGEHGFAGHAQPPSLSMAPNQLRRETCVEQRGLPPLCTPRPETDGGTSASAPRLPGAKSTTPV